MKLNNTIAEQWLYETDSENKSRYVLGRKGECILVCFGIHPGEDEPNNIDGRINSVEKTSLKNGFDNLLMFNLYPQRTKKHKELHSELDIKIHKNNLFHINSVLSRYNPPIIWAAWGDLIEQDLT